MGKDINDKINELSAEQKIIYQKELINICESKDTCTLYGAKDAANLPDEDIYRIKQNLYQEMFELDRKEKLLP